MKIKSSNAITLIALIVSIIVLLILVGVVLNLLMGENGVTNKAIASGKIYNLSEAKEKLEFQVVNYAGQFYQNKYGNGNILENSIDEYVVEKFSNGPFENGYILTKDLNNPKKMTITNEKDGITATCTIDNGIVIWGDTEIPSEKNKNAWTQNGTSITRGDVTLEVGQAITGYEANGVSNWAVLGVEDGKVLLTTLTNTENFNFSGESLFLEGITTLDAAAQKYENTTYAVAGKTRSIRIEDINRVVGYNPETAEFGSGIIFQYENEVTYYWDGTEYPYYSTKNGLTGKLTQPHNDGFSYYDKNINSFVTVPMSITATEENKEKITTIKNTYYSYGGKNLLSTDSLAYKLLFDKTASWEPQGYWLANQVICTWDNYALFSLRSVGMWEALVATGCNSSNLSNGQGDGLRPVVELQSDVKINSEGVISK